MVSSKLKDYLDEAGVEYERHSHAPAYTSLEIAHAVHVPGSEMVKSVMLKLDSEGGDGQLVMAVLSANDVANLDLLREEIGCGVLRLARESEFRDAFPSCKPGAMPPFGNIFNVPTFCEANLAQNLEIEFNGGTHEETIRMKFDDYKRLAKPKMVHFAEPYSEGLQRLAA
jgi:Ala-tRNA(Pro) deacylase